MIFLLLLMFLNTESHIVLVNDQIPEVHDVIEEVKEVEEVEYLIAGEASYYSEEGCLGCNPELIMANGDRLDDTAYTVALPPHLVSKHKLLNKKVRIVNLSNGRDLFVKVTDTGGFYKLTNGKRVADLSVASKEALGCDGLCEVEVY